MCAKFGQMNLEDTKGDTFMETKNEKCHEDVSHMEKDLDTRVYQNIEKPKESTVQKVDTPIGFELDDDQLSSQILDTKITICCPIGLDYATAIHRNRQLGQWNRSSYLIDFGSASSSSIIPTPILDKKHPFENAFLASSIHLGESMQSQEGSDMSDHSQIMS
ncbi:hypothetical protein HAX54_021506 [Datura stramonium]|uniref:Uncharacterized protein n=1 Tax=Datura stramonium TaxID=4076 RepID=A0ABS8UVU6_DATST|nr:hypothetical protein [Datura stramonium]